MWSLATIDCDRSSRHGCRVLRYLLIFFPTCRCVDASVSPFTITFSAQTSANMTQDMLDAKMEKRRKGVYGPPAGKQFVVHVDDLNMPKR